MDDVSKQGLQSIGRASRALRQVRPSEAEVLLARVCMHLIDGSRIDPDLVAACLALSQFGRE